MTIDRRNFLQRLTGGLAALMLADRFKTQEPSLEFEGLQARADAERAMRDAHPMRYARVTVEADSDGGQEAFYETASSPDGPWRRPARVRQGLPPVQWRQLNRAEEIAVMLRTPNEVLLQLPWIER